MDLRRYKCSLDHKIRVAKNRDIPGIRLFRHKKLRILRILIKNWNLNKATKKPGVLLKFLNNFYK